MLHVAHRVDVDQKRNGGDHNEHDAGQGVHQVPDRHHKLAGRNPGIEGGISLSATDNLRKDRQRLQEGNRNRSDAEDSGDLAQLLAEHAIDCRRRQRGNRNKPNKTKHQSI